MLEAMAERQVTADSNTHALPSPFMVIATQNPVEHEGTYRLPESELDRFLLRIRMGYPDPLAETAMLDAHGTSDPLDALSPILSVNDVTKLVEATRSVYVAPSIKNYAVEIANSTRRNRNLALGLSPRGTLGLQASARAWATVAARNFVTPDDIKAVAHPVLEHRMLLTPQAELAGLTVRDVVDETLATAPVPTTRGT